MFKNICVHCTCINVSKNKHTKNVRQKHEIDDAVHDEPSVDLCKLVDVESNHKRHAQRRIDEAERDRDEVPHLPPDIVGIEDVAPLVAPEHELVERRRLGPPELILFGADAKRVCLKINVQNMSDVGL